jgi:hypothetical protein
MVSDLLTDLHAAGVTLVAEGNTLRARPAHAMTPDLRERVRQNKPELVVLLAAAHRWGIEPEALAEALDNPDGETGPATDAERRDPLMLDVVARLLAGESTDLTRQSQASGPTMLAGNSIGEDYAEAKPANVGDTQATLKTVSQPSHREVLP